MPTWVLAGGVQGGHFRALQALRLARGGVPGVPFTSVPHLGSLSQALRWAPALRGPSSSISSLPETFLLTNPFMRACFRGGGGPERDREHRAVIDMSLCCPLAATSGPAGSQDRKGAKLVLGLAPMLGPGSCRF